MHAARIHVGTCVCSPITAPFRHKRVSLPICSERAQEYHPVPLAYRPVPKITTQCPRVPPSAQEYHPVPCFKWACLCVFVLSEGFKRIHVLRLRLPSDTRQSSRKQEAAHAHACVGDRKIIGFWWIWTESARLDLLALLDLLHLHLLPELLRMPDTPCCHTRPTGFAETQNRRTSGTAAFASPRSQFAPPLPEAACSLLLPCAHLS